MNYTLIAGSHLEDFGPGPGTPDLYYDVEGEKRHTSTEKKISKGSKIVAEYMRLALPNRGSNGTETLQTANIHQRISIG